MSDLLQNHMSKAILLEHMQKKLEINWTKNKGGCQSGRKKVTHNSKSDLPLVEFRTLGTRNTSEIFKPCYFLEDIACSIAS